MKHRPLDDVSTASPRRQGGESQAAVFVPALTIVSHPLASRVGERLVLDALPRGREVAVSRNAPLFTQVGEAVGRPLGDPFVSRKPLRFQARSDGGVRLEGDPDGTRVVAGGMAGVSWEFRPEALAAGVSLELAGRVVLWLHRVAQDDLGTTDTLGMVGQGPALNRVRTRVRQVADLEVPVLIRGETGTGKELVARALHLHGPRRDGPFVSVNLGTLARELASAELFGVQRGAYTGASRSREGFFRAAQGGTLFLDEVGEASSEVQVALLRVLETGEVFPVGAHAPIATDVRLVAATDAPLEELIAQGRFRAPLLHRLSGYSIHMPPLRERREDLLLLFHHFARRELEALGEAGRLSPEDPYAEPWLPAALATRLLCHEWSGNVRQLRNVARQLVISGRGQPRLQADAALEAGLTPGREVGLATLVSSSRRRPSEVTEAELLSALRECSWDLKATAERLGITRASLYNLVDRSPDIRTVRDLGAEEITRCFHACGGDLDAMVRRLEVSRRALQRRVRELGLEAHDS
ncbi:sigma-54 dependent transcriptional regulator [Myxococcus sp. K15C18031901]|uniref:sigma 54-interacting transcriptional regulator n=1 Tax=Myxococcus dinghuensis TaxID=2906761 RepID=UPI0020A7E11E|nr:sigma-54 dependent transcriptional regulator [Myxococcus dinghuensis]MCP3097427.1 sigma-54 dependent transcriptional regulator [Myxococcus dinghuensis]